MEIQPGGIVPLHSHADRPALIMVNQGQIFEYSSKCTVPIPHKAGEIARESNGAHALVEERRQRRRRADDRRHRQRQEARLDDADDVTGRIAEQAARALRGEGGARRPRARADASTMGAPMEILLTSVAFVVAAICAGLMGYAIQRGATCTVAAMDEVVRRRGVQSPRQHGRGIAVGASAASLIAQSAARCSAKMPGGYAVTYVTVLGGALLGLGAYVNKACVFGAIARLGSGEWAYVVDADRLLRGMRDRSPRCSRFRPSRSCRTTRRCCRRRRGSRCVFGAFMLWRLGRALLRRVRAERADGPLPQSLARALATRVWSPHAATTVIGITFFIMLLLVGAWAYTDVLAELARGMAGNLVARTLLLVALFAGAMLGGYTAGRFRSTPHLRWRSCVKCFAGGAADGLGQPADPRRQRRAHPRRHAAAVAVRVDRVPDDVRRTIGVALVVEKDSWATAPSRRSTSRNRSPARPRPRTAHRYELDRRSAPAATGAEQPVDGHLARRALDRARLVDRDRCRS